jgi:transposase
MTGRHYRPSYRAEMVARLTALDAPTALALSQEIGVTASTLLRWKAAAAGVEGVSKKKSISAPKGRAPDLERHARGAQEWPAAEKLRLLGAAAQLKEEELGEFLRREGLHSTQLDQWRGDLLAALGHPAAARQDPRAMRVRELEREVARKDKALAEVTALLVLRKKLTALFDDSSAEEGDSTGEKYDKK